MQGMTLKQYWRHRYYDLLAMQGKIKLNTARGRREFILVSVQLHSAKAHVPKRLWPLANRIFK